ncbi:MAG: RNA polymerase sporulation sigma factor SigG [Ruminococcaceae bacterium]|nr:RNA polymerase sporulation sigma factor SigG [Oscillospiraceae bacterium]
MFCGKVSICGVDTTKLKVLKEKEKEELLKRYKAGDMTARDELVNGNLRLVLSVVQRFTGRGENMDDLFQVGCIGLIKSIDNFDVTQQVKFSTYAVPMIIGEIRRHLRDNSPIRVSRSIKDTAYKAMKAKEEYINKYQKEPKLSEIAKMLSIDESDVVIALESIVEPISIYEPVFSEGSDMVYVLDQLGDNSSASEWLDEIALREAITKLDEREKNILTLRFMRGLTQTEVSKEIGISQAQVSRLEKNAIDKIKGND